MAIISILLTVVIITVSILMVLIVLAQRPKQEGLGAAFGGSTLDSALGAHATDVLQKITTWLGILFFVSAIGLAMVKSRQYKETAASNVLEKVENREAEVPDLPAQLQNRSDTDAATTGEAEEAPASEEQPAETEGASVDEATPAAEEAPAASEPSVEEKAGE